MGEQQSEACQNQEGRDQDGRVPVDNSNNDLDDEVSDFDSPLAQQSVHELLSVGVQLDDLDVIDDFGEAVHSQIHFLHVHLLSLRLPNSHKVIEHSSNNQQNNSSIEGPFEVVVEHSKGVDKD